MKEVKVLFIDDDEIEGIIGKLGSILKRSGITLNHTFLNLKHDRFMIPDEKISNGTKIDFVKIKEELGNVYFKTYFDLVACDYNFNDNLNGYTLIKWLKNTSKSERVPIRHAKFVLYSSEKGKALDNFFSEKELSSLIRLKLEDFIDRTSLSDKIAKILLDASNEIDLTIKLIKEMEKYKTLKFRSTYPIFNGKTLDEIINEIEKESHHGIGFQQNLIELAVAHMIELND